MYKLLLSWRYLRTRYLALASIISVMLGVATLVVVNSVMSGFATKLRDRLRGIQAHVLVEARSNEGFADYQGKMRLIERLVGDKIEAMSPVIETYAMMQFRFRKYDEDGAFVGESDPITRLVRLIGIDPEARSQTGEFGQFLQNPANRTDPSHCFKLQGQAEQWFRRYYEQRIPDARRPPMPTDPDEPPPTEAVITADEPQLFGVVVGYGIATMRDPKAKPGDANRDEILVHVGDPITLATMSRTELEGHDGTMGRPHPVLATFVVTDVFKSEMSEIDSNIVYADIRDVQRLRTMQGRATSIQIRLKNYDRDAKEVVAKLSATPQFPAWQIMIQTWEDKQGALLAAISIERGILNVLLFLIIAVAGFGILAIFFMIVVEKMRDIGILKALGASNLGVMGIFLTYGLGLGLVGALLGSALGVSITVYINEIEKLLTALTGQEVFDRKVYYFDQIPTDLQVASVVFVNFGAVLIAVGASVFPSLRAALLHPVRALRYE